MLQTILLKKVRFFTTEEQRNGVLNIFERNIKIADKIADTLKILALKSCFSL